MNKNNANNYIPKIHPDNRIENTETIISMAAEDFKHKEILNIIETTNFILKQFGAIKIDQITNEKEAWLLVSNLINNDTRVREAVSQKILSFLSSPDYNKFFQKEEIFEIMLKGLCDINPNVCRNISMSLGYIMNKQYFITQIINTINELLNNFKRERGMRKQTLNKVIYKLYWHLEGLNQLKDLFDENIEALTEIFEVTSEFEEYTIREKTAQLVIETNPNSFKNIKNKLKNDENFYVKRFFQG